MFLPRLVVLLAAGLGPALVQANTFGFSWDNDAFLGQDKNYTNGVRFSWVGDGRSDCQAKGGLTCGVARALDPLPGISASDERHALTVSLPPILIPPSHFLRPPLLLLAFSLSPLHFYLSPPSFLFFSS